MITAGVDVGTRFLKVCLVEGTTPLGHSCYEMDRKFSGLYKKAIEEAIEMARAFRGLRIKKKMIKKTISTGYGSNLVKNAEYSLNEPVCIARGAFSLNSNIRTIVDAGGLFIRVATVDENGFLVDDYVNEKCAAGSGKFLEMIADLLLRKHIRCFECISEYHRLIFQN